jgi:hypothetical protein
MLMRSNVMNMMIAAVLLGAFPIAAADVKVELGRQGKEWIGSSVIGDDGSGVVALASHSPRYSRLVSFDKSGAATELRVPGIAINSIELLGKNRYFISGATDGHYTARIIEAAKSGVVTVWDSASLGETVTRNENAVVAVDSSGTQWTALVPSTGGRFSVLFGSISSPAPAMTHHFESSGAFKGTPAPGFSGGSYDLAMLNGPRGDAHVAVLTPNGSVHVVSANSGLKAILTSPLGGGRLLWEPSTQTLWVESGAAWSSFPLAATIREPKEKTAKPALKRASLTTKFDRRSGRAVSAFPLSGGRFALRTNHDGRSAIEIFTAADAVPQVIGLSDLAPTGIIKISPSARYLLALPEGPKSNAILIKTP